MSNYNIPISEDYNDFLKKSIFKLKKSKKQVKITLDYWDSIKENPLSPNMNANVYNCGSWLKFRNYIDLDKNSLHKARFCKKDKICPACAARRAAKQVQKVYKELYSNEDLLKGNWYYIVMPVVHNSSEEFGTVFKRVQTALKKINQAIRNEERGKNSNNWFTNFDGIYYSIEETKTDNGWNVHANLLCRSKKPLQGLIRKHPKKNNGVFWNLDAVETLKQIAEGSLNISISPIKVSNKEELLKNLQEVFKYSLKFQELSPDDLLIAYRGLYRKRLIGTMGTLRGLSTDIKFNDEEIEDELFIETIYHYIKTYKLSSQKMGKTYKNGQTIYQAEDYE